MLSWALKYKGKNKSLICLGGNRYVLYEVPSLKVSTINL